MESAADKDDGGGGGSDFYCSLLPPVAPLLSNFADMLDEWGVVAEGDIGLVPLELLLVLTAALPIPAGEDTVAVAAMAPATAAVFGEEEAALGCFNGE